LITSNGIIENHDIRPAKPPAMKSMKSMLSTPLDLSDRLVNSNEVKYKPYEHESLKTDI
jgi:hypothetical protein